MIFGRYNNKILKTYKMMESNKYCLFGGEGNLANTASFLEMELYEMNKLMEIHEVSELADVSIRTLQYYDQIGLLSPTSYTESGYRLYDENTLEKLQQILLFKELGFPLKEIKDILEAPDFDRNKALSQQIELLTLKKEHLENLIQFAIGIQQLGTKGIDFSVFQAKKIKEYTTHAKEQWGKTKEYQEFEEKAKNWNEEDEKDMANQFMLLFAEFGQMVSIDPACSKVQAQVQKLKDYISDHFYQCSNEILASLGKMYAGGGEFTENIDRAGGPGTAFFTAAAIEIYCKKR